MTLAMPIETEEIPDNDNDKSTGQMLLEILYSSPRESDSDETVEEN